ncbi:CHAT domain-containing protein [Streptomyces sp. NPDC056004]|uniref:CHAT domain-containing protein n=1 Tax=Streptomyces sp. NPDC056004 TaxID=3345677 RepID=UPI0035D7BB38
MSEDPTPRSVPDPAAAVRRRIVLFRESGDPRHLTDPEAEDEHAAAVAAAVRVGRAGKPELDVTAAAESALFRFWRGVASGTPAGQVEADNAIGFFLGLRQTAPELVPAEVAEMVGILATDGTRRLRWSVESADRLLSLSDGIDPSPLDLAIDRILWALRTAPEDPAGRILALGRLGQAYHERHQASKDVADARNVVAARREAVGLSSPGRDRARRLSLLADSLLVVHERTGERACIEEAIRALEDSVAGTPPGDQFLWLRYQRLGRSHRHLAEATDSIADFDAAVRWGRLACVTADSSDTDYGSALAALDKSLRARHAKSRDRADLDEAVALWRTMLDSIPGDDARRADFLVDLGDALHRRFDSAGDPADLEESVRTCEAAVREAPEGSASWIRALSDLCYRLRRRFEHGGDVADLWESVRVGRLSVASTSLGDGEDGIITYSNLLNAAVACYDSGRELPYLDEAIELWAAVLTATPPDHAERGLRLVGRLDALERRFEHTGERADLDRVFGAARACLAAARPEFGQMAGTLLRVAVRLDTRADEADRSVNIGLELDNVRFSMRSRSTTELDAMDTLVDLARALVPSTEADEADRAIRRGCLAMALATRFRVTGSAADGAESIDVLRKMVAAAEPDDPHYSTYLSNLGDTLVSRFLRDGDATDLDAAIEAHEQAFRTVLPNAPDRADHLPRLALALRLRYDDRRNPADLEHVVAVIHDAVSEGHPAPDCRPASLSELAKVLEWRFHHTTDPADLDAAVAAGREAADLDAANEDRSVSVLSRLASALFARYEKTGNAPDLDEAISTLGTALAEMPDGDRGRPSVLHNHAVFVQARAILTGSSADFDRSVIELREVTGARSSGASSRARDFYSLGMALRVRHAHLGDDLDMHAAVEALRAALRYAAGDPVTRSIAAVGLANALTQVFHRTGDRSVLNEAITLAVEAEREFPEHGDFVSRPLSTLSWLLRMRVDLAGDPDPADVAEMLRFSKRMIDAVHPGSSDYGLFLRNRAVALTTAARARQDVTLLDQAVASARRAVEVTGAGDARRGEWLWSLGRILEQRHSVTGKRADLEATLSCWREAARDPYGDPDMVMQCAVHAARLAAQEGDVDGAVVDYGLAVRRLPTVAWHGMRTGVRSETLRRWSGLASEAAGAAIAAGQLSTAVEMLEQSRSVIWTQALHLRSDLSDLAGSHPELATRLTTLRTRLDTFAPAGERFPGGELTSIGEFSPVGELSPAGERHQLIGPAGGVRGGVRGTEFSTEAGERRRDLAREWDETVERVRQVEGFEHFLGPTPYAELKNAATDGPVVVVNVSRYGCHALIVRHDTPAPEVVALPSVSIRDVSGKVSDLLSATGAQADPSVSFLARERARHTSHDVLGWLWDSIVGPILARLGHDARPRSGRTGAAPPRLWWCPVGLLSMLPLHAAGHHPRHGSATGSGGAWTADLVVSSYTPTLAALSRSRVRRSEPAVRRHLAIALPETPGLAALPAVADELDGLRRYAANATEVVSLVGTAATRRAVLDELPHCDRIHFACHAAQDPSDPAASAFSLGDGPLSISDIADLDLAHAELAYLSACQTATGVPDLADEAIHLAAAMQLTGFRHIVATSWPVGDASAAVVSDHFYRELTSTDSGTEPAVALHRAVRALRDSDPTEPVKWASYAHFGS